MFAIRNGRVSGARFVPARVSGGEIRPTLIVLHDTAGRLDKGSSVRWFQDPTCQTSAHFVVERDGEVVQMVRTDRKAAHAGKSQWRGRAFCNAFAVGIEIVSPGKLDASGRAWFGPSGVTGIVRSATPEHGDGWWLPYTQAQIEAVKSLCRAIVAEYPDCNEIVTHWQISPGRKIDTSPLLPLDEIRAFALGGTDPAAPDTDDDFDPSWTAEATDAPASMATSTTGNTAVALGGGGTVTVATEISTAAAKVAASGKTPTVLDMLMALASSPTFWVGAITVAGAVYIWLERRAKLITHGV